MHCMCTTTISTILLWLFDILLLSYVYVVNLWTCDGELLRFAYCSNWRSSMLVKQLSSFSRQYRIYLSTVSRSVSTKQSSWLQNLWATNCVVNQTGYFDPLYSSKHHTSLWRRQHIYSVQLLQTAAESASPSIAIVRSFVYKHCVANASDHTAQPAATSSPQWLLNTGESPASGDANTMWFLSAVIQPLIDSKRQRQIGWW